MSRKTATTATTASRVPFPGRRSTPARRSAARTSTTTRAASGEPAISTIAAGKRGADGAEELHAVLDVELAVRQRERQEQRDGRAHRRRTPGLRRVLDDPGDEDEQPERHDVEEVAVVQAVDPEGRIHVRHHDGDEDEERGVHRDEHSEHRGFALGARPCTREPDREHDRRNGTGNDGEVEVEVGQVVQEPPSQRRPGSGRG